MASAHTVEPSTDIPANRPREREYVRIYARKVTSAAASASRKCRGRELDQTSAGEGGGNQLESRSRDYFKALAEETALPYQKRWIFICWNARGNAKTNNEVCGIAPTNASSRANVSGTSEWHESRLAKSGAGGLACTTRCIEFQISLAAGGLCRSTWRRSFAWKVNGAL